MTRSEKKKIAYEQYKQHKMESSVRCIQSKLFIDNCCTCEFCKKIQMENSEKWICNKKARKPMKVINNEGLFSSGTPYSDLNGKCEAFTLMTMLNED